jgi:hypothetical protein
MINILSMKSIENTCTDPKIGTLRTERYFPGSFYQVIHERYGDDSDNARMPKIAGHIAAKYISGCGFVMRDLVMVGNAETVAINTSLSPSCILLTGHCCMGNSTGIEICNPQ